MKFQFSSPRGISTMMDKAQAAKYELTPDNVEAVESGYMTLLCNTCIKVIHNYVGPL